MGWKLTDLRKGNTIVEKGRGEMEEKSGEKVNPRKNLRILEKNPGWIFNPDVIVIDS